MPRNVEIKARVRDRPGLEKRVAAVADGKPVILAQDDTFFTTPAGRLKLRRLSPGGGELIAYHRPDAAGPRTSSYRVVAVDEPEAVATALATALGVSGRVCKERTLYRLGRTRIHLDRVDGLGDFMELEVVLAEGEDEAAGRREAADLMERLGIHDGDLVPGAYLDLLRATP